MARSLRNRSTPAGRLLCASAASFTAWLGLCGNTAAANAGASETKCTEPIDVKADSAGVDYKKGTTQLRNVVISQCDIRVEAKQASATSTNGLDFDNTRWTFDGDVRINVEKRGSLRSNQAVVDFQNNQISKATITGSPAEFEQVRAETDTMARGHAGEIVYEVGPGTVRLANDAWLKYGTTEMKGSSLVYNIREEQVQGASQPGDRDRVHIRITPKPTPPPAPKGESGTRPGGTATPAPAGSPQTSPQPSQTPPKAP